MYQTYESNYGSGSTSTFYNLRFLSPDAKALKDWRIAYHNSDKYKICQVSLDTVHHTNILTYLNFKKLPAHQQKYFYFWFPVRRTIFVFHRLGNHFRGLLNQILLYFAKVKHLQLHSINIKE